LNRPKLVQLNMQMPLLIPKEEDTWDCLSAGGAPSQIQLGGFPNGLFANFSAPDR